MSPELFTRLAIGPALSLLPPQMDSRAARVMVLAICLQESRLMHRRQIGGPARGFAQFEVAGVRGVLTHRASRAHALAAMERLCYEPTVAAAYDAIEHNDMLAVIFARLLLWTLPQPLPDDAEEGWRQYLEAWRPGKPHPKTWHGHYSTAVVTLAKPGG